MQQVADVKPSKAEPVSEATFADLLRPLIDPGFRLALAMLHDTAEPNATSTRIQMKWLSKMAHL